MMSNLDIDIIIDHLIDEINIDWWHFLAEYFRKDHKWYYEM